MLVLAVLVALCQTMGRGQTGARPLTEEQVLKLLRGDVASVRVAQLARERGIDFTLSPDDERRLRRAGADSALIETLKNLVPTALTLSRSRSSLARPVTMPNNIVSKLHESAIVIAQVMSSERSIPRDVIARTECIATMPDVDTYHSGFVSCRNRVGGWTAPAGVILEGSNLAGRVLVAIMNPSALKQLTNVLALNTTGVLTWEVDNGTVLAIVPLGGLLRPDDVTNTVLYQVKDLDVILGTMTPPPGSPELLYALNKYFSRR
jgi:hypothetical protein